MGGSNFISKSYFYFYNLDQIRDIISFYLGFNLQHENDSYFYHTFFFILFDLYSFRWFTSGGCLYEIVLLFSCSLSLILSLCFLFLSYFILLFSLFKIVWFQISSRWIGDHSRYGIHWPAIGSPNLCPPWLIPVYRFVVGGQI